MIHIYIWSPCNSSPAPASSPNPSTMLRFMSEPIPYTVKLHNEVYVLSTSFRNKCVWVTNESNWALVHDANKRQSWYTWHDINENIRNGYTTMRRRVYKKWYKRYKNVDIWCKNSRQPPEWWMMDDFFQVVGRLPRSQDDTRSHDSANANLTWLKTRGEVGATFSDDDSPNCSADTRYRCQHDKDVCGKCEWSSCSSSSSSSSSFFFFFFFFFVLFFLSGRGPGTTRIQSLRPWLRADLFHDRGWGHMPPFQFWKGNDMNEKWKWKWDKDENKEDKLVSKRKKEKEPQVVNMGIPSFEPRISTGPRETSSRHGDDWDAR